MLDVRRLLVLRELARLGTVAATADALHLTPSAVSQQLAALGRESGVRLLEPEGRRLRLTGAARVLLTHAEAVFAELQRAEASLEAHLDGQLGEVAVAAFPTAIGGLVVPAMQLLSQRSPGLDVLVQDLPDGGGVEALLHGEVDLCVSILTSTADLAPDRTVVTPLLTDLLDVALPRKHPLVDCPEVPFSALAGESLVMGPNGSACSQVTLAACAAAGFVPRIRHRTDDWQATVSLVAAGAGVALVPRLAQPVMAVGAVVRPIAGSAPQRRVVAVVRQGSESAPHVAAVLTALVDVATR